MLSRYVTAFFCLLLSCQLRDKPVDRSTLRGNDYRLFQATPLWEVAKAVQDDDTTQLAALVRGSRLNLNYQEPRFGKTVLMLAVANGEYAACQVLLRLGASAMVHDHYDGTSAVLVAADKDNPQFLTLLLAHGGSPNDLETGPRRTGDTQRNTPLMVAVRAPAQATVKALVEAGADVNYQNEFGTTALSVALLQDQFAIALYLLQHGADPRKPLFQRPTPNGQRPIYLPEYLNEARQRGRKAEEIERLFAFYAHSK